MAKIYRLKIHKLCFVTSILFSVIGCDQTTKQLARVVIPKSGDLSFFGDSFLITSVQNFGAFLSFGAHWPDTLRFLVFQLITAMFLVFVCYQLIKQKTNLQSTFAYSMLLAGGIGNMIDRVLFGSVTDFLLFSVGPFHTGIFNVADISIVMGVGLLLVSQITDRPGKTGNRIETGNL